MEIFGGNIPAAVQYLLAFVFILALLAGLAAVLRRITGGRHRIGFSATSARHRQQRLGVIDAVDIDAHRQLLLLRRDNVEHLVMIGGPNDLLVESGIGRQMYRTTAPLPTQQHAANGGEDTIPEHPVDADLRTAAPRGAPAVEAPVHGTMGSSAPIAPVSVDVQTPGLTEPSISRAPSGVRPMATPTAPATAPLAATRAIPPASLPPVSPFAPAKPASEREMPAKVAGAQVQPGLGQGEGAVRPSAGVSTGPAAPMPPVPPAFPAMPAGRMPSQAPASAPAPSAPPSSSAAPSAGKAETPQRPVSGMTRQLEEALKRPFGAVRPSPVTGIKLEETPAGPSPEAEKVPGPTPLEAAPSPAVKQPVRAQGAEAVPPFVAPVPAAPIVPPRQAAPVEPVRTAPMAPMPPVPPVAGIAKPFAPGIPGFRPSAPIPQEPASPVAPPAPQRAAGEKVSETAKRETAEKAPTPAEPAPESAKVPSFDLSSLENIEAEFARLLGRTPPSKGE